MPLYEYECRKCHHRFEEIQKVGDRPIKKCPKCKKGPVQKLVSSPAVHFKGTGWYITDYGRKQPAGSQPSDKEAAGKDKEAAGKDKEAKEKPSREPKEAAADSGARKDSGKKGPLKD